MLVTRKAIAPRIHPSARVAPTASVVRDAPNNQGSAPARSSGPRSRTCATRPRGKHRDQRVRAARAATRQVPVEGHICQAGVVERDQQAQAPERVGGGRRGSRGAGVAEVGGIVHGVRENRRGESGGRDEAGRSSCAGQRDARREPPRGERRRGQARDRSAVRPGGDPLPRGAAAWTRNDSDLHARAEVADWPPIIIRPSARHNEQYGAPRVAVIVI
jgi:hypothetical protein